MCADANRGTKYLKGRARRKARVSNKEGGVVLKKKKEIKKGE